MSETDQYVANNAIYASERGRRELPIIPSKHVAVIACMDSRIDVFRVLGLKEGEAHIIRNAGGVVTDDALRSLIISQRLLKTREIILIHHTDCGMLIFRDDELRAQIAAEVGEKPLVALQSFSDLKADILECMHRIRTNPFLRHRDVRGFVLDVATGKLNEVHAPAGASD